MEELLNKLIEKGWKPIWWKKKIKEVHFLKDAKSIVFFFEALWDNCRTRELVSKESWLWQFVCENGMAKDIDLYDEDIDEFFSWTKEYYCESDPERSKRLGVCDDSSYEYRLIESALKDESELEEFLLNNIKIDD